ncbi:MAG: YozE family protein [Synechocystis sp.]
MKKINPRDLINSVPHIQSVTLPDNWFDNIDTKYSVFGYLYKWMLKNNRVPHDPQNDIAFRPYAGEKIYKKLLLAEEKRLKHIYKYKGEDLEYALSWNCMQSAPMNKIAGLDISGNAIFVIPDESMDAMREFAFKVDEEICDKKIKNIRAQAAGANFRNWLISQTERPDRIGDLAQDIECDSEFPINADNYEKLEIYLKSKYANRAVIECLRAAWFEYMKQYPDRIIPCAYCSECDESVDLNDAILCFSEYAVYVFHSTCRDQLDGVFDIEKTFYLKEIEDNLGKIEEFFHQIKKEDTARFFKHKWDDMHEKLQLWGILPIDRQGTIYFIQSELKDSIKIGYTAGHPEVRLKSLQTSHPYKLKIIATIPGKPEYEKFLHKRFAQYQLNREWFECHPDILAFISTLKN